MVCNEGKEFAKADIHQEGMDKRADTHTPKYLTGEWGRNKEGYPTLGYKE
jgi:hypothetical protein